MRNPYDVDQGPRQDHFDFIGDMTKITFSAGAFIGLYKLYRHSDQLGEMIHGLADSELKNVIKKHYNNKTTRDELIDDLNTHPKDVSHSSDNEYVIKMPLPTEEEPVLEHQTKNIKAVRASIRTAERKYHTSFLAQTDMIIDRNADHPDAHMDFILDPKKKFNVNNKKWKVEKNRRILVPMYDALASYAKQGKLEVEDLRYLRGEGKNVVDRYLQDGFLNMDDQNRIRRMVNKYIDQDPENFAPIYKRKLHFYIRHLKDRPTLIDKKLNMRRYADSTVTPYEALNNIHASNGTDIHGGQFGLKSFAQIPNLQVRALGKHISAMDKVSIIDFGQINHTKVSLMAPRYESVIEKLFEVFQGMEREGKIKSFDFKIKGFKQGQLTKKWFEVETIVREDLPPKYFRIGLADHNVLPGSINNVGSRVDMFLHDTMHNTEMYNLTETMFRRIISHFSSPQITGEIIMDPAKIFRSAIRKIKQVEQKASLTTGSISDTLEVAYDEEIDARMHARGKAGARLKEMDQITLETMDQGHEVHKWQRMIERGEKKRVILLTIDCETVSPKHGPTKLGPEHLAKSSELRVTQVSTGFVELTGRGSPITHLGGIKNVSSHGVKELIDTFTFDPADARFWLQSMGIVGNEADQLLTGTKEDIIKNVSDRYYQHLLNEEKRLGTKFTSDMDIVTTTIRQTMEMVKRMHLTDDDKLVIVWNYGKKYDEALMANRCDKMVWEIFKQIAKDSIDTHFLHRELFKYSNEFHSLGLEELLWTFLNKIAPDEMKAANMTKDAMTQDFNKVYDILEKKGMIKTANSDVRKFLKENMSRMHGEAQADIIGTVFTFLDANNRLFGSGKGPNSGALVDPFQLNSIRSTLDQLKRGIMPDVNYQWRIKHSYGKIKGKVWTDFLASTTQGVSGKLLQHMPGHLHPFGIASNLSKQLYQRMKGLNFTIEPIRNEKRRSKINRKLGIKFTTTTMMEQEKLLKEQLALDKKYTGIAEPDAVHQYINLRTANVIYSAGQDEGHHVLSREIGELIKLLDVKTVRLDSVNFGSEFLEYSEFMEKVLQSAMRAAAGGKPSIEQIKSEMWKELEDRGIIDKQHTINRGTVLAHGNMGDLKIGMDATILDLSIADDPNLLGDMHYAVTLRIARNVPAHMATGLKSVSWWHKAMTTVASEHAPHAGLYGHDVSTDARWLKDGNISAFKDMEVRKIQDQFQSTIDGLQRTIDQIRVSLESTHDETHWNRRKRESQLGQARSLLAEKKRSYRKFIKELGVHRKLDKMVFDPDKNSRPNTFHLLNDVDNELAQGIYGFMNIGDIKEQMKIFEIHGKAAGLSTWSKEEIREYFESFCPNGKGSAREGAQTLREIIKTYVEGSNKKIDDAINTTLSHLKGDKEKINSVKRQAEIWINRMFIPRVNKTKYFQWQRSDTSNKYSLKNLIYSGNTIWNFQQTEIKTPGFQYHDIKMSKYVADKVLESRYLDARLKNFMKETMTYNVPERDRVRSLSMERVHDLMKGTIPSDYEIKKVDYDKLRDLLLKPELKKYTEKNTGVFGEDGVLFKLETELHSNHELSVAWSLSGHPGFEDYFEENKEVIDAQITDLALRMSKKNITNPEAFKKYKQGIIDQLRSKPQIIEHHGGGTTWMAMEDASHWAKFMQERQGILSLSANELGLKNGSFVFDINQMIDHMNIPMEERDGTRLQLLNYFKNLEKNQNPHNRNVTRVNSSVFHVKNIHVWGPTHIEDIANKLTDELGRETEEQKPLRALLSAIDIYKRMQGGEFNPEGPSPVKYTREQIENNPHLLSKMRSQEITMMKMWSQYLLHLPSRPDTYRIAGQMTTARNALSLVERAHQIDLAGIKNTLIGAKMEGSDSEVEEFTRILNKIKSAKPNHVFASEHILDQLCLDPAGLGMSKDIDKIKLVEHLQKMSNGKARLSALRRGEADLTGGQLRYPNEPQGDKAVQSMLLSFIPEKYRKLLNMDKEDTYHFSIHGAFQKIDYDGDKVAMFLNNFKTLEALDKNISEAKSHWLIRQKAMAWQMDSFFMPVGSYTVNGIQKTRFLMYNDNGNLTHEDLTIEEAKAKRSMYGDYYKKFLGDHISDFGANLAMQTGEVMSPQMFLTIRAKSALSSVMKDGMGLFTNAMEKADIKARLMPGSHKAGALDLASDMQHFLGNLLQNFTDLAKRGSYDEVFDVSNMFKVINGDLTNKGTVDVVRNKFIQSYSDIAYGVAKDALSGDKAAAYSAKLEFESGRGEHFARVKKHIDTFLYIQGIFHEATQNNKLQHLNLKNRVAYLMTHKDMGPLQYFEGISPSSFTVDELTDIVREQQQKHKESGMDEFEKYWENTKKRFSKEHFIFDTYGKKLGKFGLIGAGVFLAASMFSPVSKGDSLGPFGAYSSIGGNNLYRSDLQLDRGIPLDTINPSFNDDNFIRMQDVQGMSRKFRGKNNYNMIASDITSMGADTFNPAKNRSWTTKDYTSYIGNLGSSNLERRRQYR